MAQGTRAARRTDDEELLDRLARALEAGDPPQRRSRRRARAARMAHRRPRAGRAPRRGPGPRTDEHRLKRCKIAAQPPQGHLGECATCTPTSEVQPCSSRRSRSPSRPSASPRPPPRRPGRMERARRALLGSAVGRRARHRLSSSDAADVVQTCWLRLIEHLARIRKPEGIGAWLATTARRECSGTLRRANRCQPSEAVAVLVDSHVADVDARLLENERDAAIRRAFARLPAGDQALLQATDRGPEAELSGDQRRPGDADRLDRTEAGSRARAPAP